MCFTRVLPVNKSGRMGVLKWENNSTSMIQLKSKPWATTTGFKSFVKDMTFPHFFGNRSISIVGYGSVKEIRQSLLP